MNDYQSFLAAKRSSTPSVGISVAKTDLTPQLFDFQKHLATWALEQGRAAMFADTGLGKTPMQLTWAENIVRKTNGKILVLAPLAVSYQTVEEGAKFGIEVIRSKDGQASGDITVTNYESLHHFNPDDFIGVVLDESSAIKHFAGARQKQVTQFMAKMPYRLLCTATAAPNDYIELGTAAEALGQMGRMDMLATFFKNDENSLHPIWWGARWRFKAHAETAFWRWVASWAKACRKPSDLGAYDDSPFNLPPLELRETTVKNVTREIDTLWVMPAITLDEQRKERRLTLRQRCEEVAAKVDHGDPALAWCQLNAEGDLLERLIPDAKQVKGSDSDEEKEETLHEFAQGNLRVLVTKPQIGAWGLNLQHCRHMTFFPSHSFEQYYQAVRRCWRFGQTQTVVVDVITTEGESGVLKNLQRKAEQADRMFEQLTKYMNKGQQRERVSTDTTTTEVPAWL